MIPPTVFHTSAWAAIQRHIEEEVQRLRILNDSPASAEVTAANRGEIRFALRLLALAETPAPIQREAPDFYDS